MEREQQCNYQFIARTAQKHYGEPGAGFPLSAPIAPSPEQLFNLDPPAWQNFGIFHVRLAAELLNLAANFMHLDFASARKDVDVSRVFVLIFRLAP
jgi:hypothetical protein